MIRDIAIVWFVFLVSMPGSAQDTFKIMGNQESYNMPFKLINNLIIIPIGVNGSELNFLLDTGISNTIMFNLDIKDSLKLKNIEKVRLRGLGEGGHLNALKSTNNTFRIGKVINGYHMIYLIPGKEFDLSSQLGININGIIGGDLFHDFVIDINYSSKRLKFYAPKAYTYKKCRKCNTFELKFHKKKPYINLQVQNNGKAATEVKLLIDSGAGDALWLFENSNESIQIPEKYYVDYLGKGLSGNIYGKRAKIDKIIIGDYFFTNANVSYPDSSSIGSAIKNKQRNGTLGSEILKRFRVIFDYPHRKITFLKKSKFYSDPFLYNMSGLELSYSGMMLVKEKHSNIDRGLNKSANATVVEIVYNYVYAFKQSYQISVVRKDSPAYRAGLLVGDIILQINGKPAYNFKLQEINRLFSEKPGKQIKLLIDRNGEVLTYSFRLESML